MSPNVSRNIKKKRLNTLFAWAMWSDRDPDAEWHQIGGLHYQPIGSDVPKLQVDHATQQLFYRAVSAFVDAASGYSEALQRLLMYARVGLWLSKAHPEIFSKGTDAVSELATRRFQEAKEAAGV